MAGKSKRASKTSKGQRRSSRKVKLSEIQKALLSRGALARIRPL